MSISAKRLQFLDKENKVLVKDFLKEVTGNKILSNFLAPVLTKAGLASVLEGAKALNDLVNNFSNLYEKLSDPATAGALVANMLPQLDLTDPRLADVAGVLQFLKDDTTGAKDRFLTQVLSSASDSLINNPALLYQYKGVTTNTQTLLILSALSKSGATVLKTDFNRELIATTSNTSSSAIDPNITPTSTTTSVQNNPAPVVTPKTPIVSSVSEMASLQMTIDQYNNLVATRIYKPDYTNPLLKPLEDSSSTDSATDQEFGKIVKFFMIYAMFKVGSYRAYTYNLYAPKTLFNDIRDASIPITQISGVLTEFCVNVVTDTTYGARKLLQLFGGCAQLLVDEIKTGAYTQDEIDGWYDRFMEVVESITALGYKDSATYKILERHYNEVLFAGEASAARELSTEMIDRLAGSAFDLLGFGNSFKTVIDSITTVAPADLTALAGTTNNFVGVHASLHLYFRQCRKLSVIKPSQSFDSTARNKHLLLLAMLCDKCTDYSAKPLTPQPTKDLLEKLPDFLASFAKSSIFKKSPTETQLSRYSDFDMVGMWNLLRAKSKRLRESQDYLALMNTPADDLLARYTDDQINDDISKAYAVFEQEADYASTDDLNIVTRFSSYFSGDDGVRPAVWVVSDPESFSL